MFEEFLGTFIEFIKEYQRLARLEFRERNHIQGRLCEIGGELCELAVDIEQSDPYFKGRARNNDSLGFGFNVDETKFEAFMTDLIGEDWKDRCTSDFSEAVEDFVGHFTCLEKYVPLLNTRGFGALIDGISTQQGGFDAVADALRKIDSSLVEDKGMGQFLEFKSDISKMVGNQIKDYLASKGIFYLLTSQQRGKVFVYEFLLADASELKIGGVKTHILEKKHVDSTVKSVFGADNISPSLGAPGIIFHDLPDSRLYLGGLYDLFDPDDLCLKRAFGDSYKASMSREEFVKKTLPELLASTHLHETHHSLIASGFNPLMEATREASAQLYSAARSVNPFIPLHSLYEVAGSLNFFQPASVYALKLLSTVGYKEENLPNYAPGDLRWIAQEALTALELQKGLARHTDREQALGINPLKFGAEILDRFNTLFLR